MIVTLLTDFGTSDYFVGAMKGAVLSQDPSAQIVDITHDIDPHDIDAAAFTLVSAFTTFPKGTVHVAVVDPGVGSSRRGIVASASGYFFVGPDNGIFSHVFERAAGLRVFHLTNREHFREPVSDTFHGRDIFAPVAGAISRGVDVETLGEPISDFVRLAQSTPHRSTDGTLSGTIIHVDRFGNCITNIAKDDLPQEAFQSGVRVTIGDHEIRRMQRFFGAGPDERKDPFVVWGSAGFLEIAIFRDSAARVLGIRRGAKITVRSGATA